MAHPSFYTLPDGTVIRLAAVGKVTTPMGTEFSYSFFGEGLTGRVLFRVADKSLSALQKIREDLLEALEDAEIASGIPQE